jgi:hypothetical protein
MVAHKYRLGAIALFLVLDVAALLAVHFGLAPAMVESLRPTFEAVCMALAAAALPALADAMVVEKRRQDPNVPAIKDDFRAEDRK